LNDDNHVKTLLSKYEQLQKELNLDKSQERLDNHEGKLNSIWEGNALLKKNILDIKHTLIKAFPNISARERS